MKVIPKTGETRERELTPSEIRGVLLQLSRKLIPESLARPAIDALNKIMGDAGATTSQPSPLAPGKPGR